MPEGSERLPAAGERRIADRYLVLRELGKGGMGRVWLAADELLGRMVAIKELRPPDGLTGADPGTHQRRAMQEARSAARITHPNAVTLYEVFSVAGDDAVYLAMEYVDGPTLGRLIAEGGPLPSAQVARYGLQVLDVLAAAHALGIVHRDIKPDNILIAAGDQAKLADFGIAHTVGSPRLTTSGSVVGTPAYLAPELFYESPITPAADLWSLGATLYHAAEGHGAFDKDNASAAMHAILLEDIPAPHCDPRLAAAITALLCRDPTGRATIEQARTSLRAVPGQRLAMEPEPRAPSRLGSPEGPTTQPVPVAPADRRRGGRRLSAKRQATVAVALLALATAGTVGGVLATHLGTGHPNTGPTRSATPTATSGRATSATATSPPAGATSPPARPTANGDLVPGQTIQAPAGTSGITYSPDGSLLATYGKDDGSDATLLNLATGTSTNLPFGTGAPDVAFSPDSTMVAVAERFGGVGLWSITLHRQTFNVTDDYFATGVAFSPINSNMLAVGDGDGVRLLNLTTSAFGAPLAGSSGVTGPWTVLFSPNGATLAAVDRNTGYTYVWDVGTGALEGTIAPPVPGDVPGPGMSIGYTPDSGLLAISYSVPTSTAPGIRFWATLQRGVVAHMQYPGVGDVNAFAYDPTSTEAAEIYAVVGTNGHLFLWELPKGLDLGDAVNSGDVPLVDVAFGPTGKQLATLDANAKIILWTVK